jgi:hypothetical protein
MFSFFRKGASPASSLAIQQALVKQGVPFGMSVNRLRVLTRQGNYAGRSVRYFRAFDADQAAQGGLAPRTFDDLDAHPDLVIGSGHLEREGGVVLTRREPSTRAPSPTRASADRIGHADDAHLVFWDAEGSRTSAVHLSEAAATWHNARSSQATGVSGPGAIRA